MGGLTKEDMTLGGNCGGGILGGIEGFGPENAEHRPGTAAPKKHPMLRLRLIAPPHGIGYLSQRHLGAVARSDSAANTLIRLLAHCSNK